MGLKPPINLGDVLKAIKYLGGAGATSYKRILHLLGFNVNDDPEPVKTPAEPLISDKPPVEMDELKVELEEPTGANEAWVEIEAAAMASEVPDWFASTAALPPTSGSEGLPALERQPLLEPMWSHAILQTALARESGDGELDLDSAIERLASMRPLTKLPRRQRRRMNVRVQVLIDTEETMAPYAGDQQQLLEELRNLLPDDLLEIAYSEGCPLGKSDNDGEGAYAPPQRGSTIVLLSDLALGVSLPYSRYQPWWWRRFLHVLRERDCRVLVFFPYEFSRVPRSFLKLATFIPWRRETTSGRIRQLCKVDEWQRGRN